MIDKIDGIYIIHAPKGYELHEKRVVELFKKLNLKFEFVGDAEPRLIDEWISPLYIQSQNKGAILCTASHLLACQKVLDNNNLFALIFEDDPFFLGDFRERLKKLEPEISKLEPGFIISLENTTLRLPSVWQTKKNQFLYQAKKGRAAAGYLIDKKAAEIMMNYLSQEKCHLVIDWWHNYLVDNNILKMYWVHPPLMEQGSHNGEQSAPKSTQQKSLSRIVNWRIQKFYKYGFRRLFNESRIID